MSCRRRAFSTTHLERGERVAGRDLAFAAPAPERQEKRRRHRRREREGVSMQAQDDRQRQAKRPVALPRALVNPVPGKGNGTRPLGLRTR